MTFKPLSIKQTLSKKTTSFCGIKLSAVIISCIVLILLLLLIFTLVFIYWRLRKRNITRPSKHEANLDKAYGHCSMDRRLLSRNAWDIEMNIRTPEKEVTYSDILPSNEETNGGHNNNNNNSNNNVGFLGRYSLEEIEETTNGLAYENVIESGEYGEVFYGILMDDTQVAVKNLFSNRSMKKTFVREAEAMMLVRHKNLVKLLGYCAEGTYRMLVFEYVDNGNLEYWLHKCKSKESPLTWNIRTKIIIGIAKGLAYLHEDTQPLFVHGNIKSSNILLDQQWDPKISEVGTTRFLGPGWNNYPQAGMSGYIDPEHDSNRALDEKVDVYSFGVLIMEIVSGKTAISESTVSEIEEYLVEWIKYMVAEENHGLIIDPKLPELPSRKELKRVLLIALRCVDPNVEKRPRIGQIIRMLEPRDLLLSDEICGFLGRSEAIPL